MKTEEFLLILSVISMIFILSSCERPEEITYDSGQFFVQLSLADENDEDSEVIAHIIGQSATDSAIKIPASIELDSTDEKFGSSGSYRVASVKNLSADTIDLSSISSQVDIDLPKKEVILEGFKFKMSDDNQELAYLGIHDKKEHLEKVPLKINGIAVDIPGEYKGTIFGGYYESGKHKVKTLNKLLRRIDKDFKLMTFHKEYQEVLLKWRSQVIDDRIKVSGNSTTEFKLEKDLDYDWKGGKKWSRYDGKWIEIVLSRQELIMHDGPQLQRGFKISAAAPGYETPIGEFPIIDRFPIKDYLVEEDGKLELLPDVKWSVLFTERKHYIHAATWHDDFGTPVSHGCVNMKKGDAKIIYDFLADVPLNDNKIIVVHE